MRISPVGFRNRVNLSLTKPCRPIPSARRPAPSGRQRQTRRATTGNGLTSFLHTQDRRPVLGHRAGTVAGETSPSSEARALPSEQGRQASGRAGRSQVEAPSRDRDPVLRSRDRPLRTVTSTRPAWWRSSTCNPPPPPWRRLSFHSHDKPSASRYSSRRHREVPPVYRWREPPPNNRRSRRL